MTFVTTLHFQELDIQPFYLRDLMTDASIMFRTAANKKGLTFNEDTTNLYQGEVLGDLPRMRQVLLK
jgi:signal transduction histidine kinase